MKPVFLITLCVSLTTCTVALAQSSPYSPQAPISGMPLASLDSPSGTSAPPSCPAGTNADQCTVGSYLETSKGAPECIWAEAEFLLWWMKGAHLPPLITASPASTPATQAGVLGAPTTTVLFGGNRVNDEVRSGFRFTLGAWLGDCHTLGVEGDFFMLGSEGTGFAASSTGSPILARPFFNTTTGRPDAELIAFPGLLSGSVSAHSGSTGLLGADALLRCNLCCGCNYQLDAVGGFRYLRLSDHLGVDENLLTTSAANPNFVPQGTSIILADRFDTRNEFYGFNLGLKGSGRRGPWVLQGLAQMAVGDNREVVNISGATTVTVPGAAPVSSVGGLLALPSNIGRFSKDKVEVIPEFGVRIGYQVTPRLQVFAGYTLLYWGDVLRAGSEVDLAVNPTLLPGSPVPPSGAQRPMPLLTNTSFWAQGIDLGLEFRF
jgi:hypothetical protein